MFDATALRAISDELNAKILHGRIQEIVQIDQASFAFEVYAQHTRQYLYFSVHPIDARVHLISHKLRGNAQAPSPFLLLLRKHAENSFIHSITQLPDERVLKIHLDHAVEGLSTLVIETIGKYSNLILIDIDGFVIDALKRIGANVNRARVTLPKHLYTPPPPQAKLNRSALTPAELSKILSMVHTEPLWQTLVKTIAGVSPLLAREIAGHTQGDLNGLSEPTQAAKIIETLERLTHAPWQPTVAFEDGEPAAFAPYWLTQFNDVRAFDSISAAIEAFYGTAETYAAIKESMRTPIVDARDRLTRKRDALVQEQMRAGDIERLRVSGEMILAYAHTIEPRQAILRAETENGIIEIPLDSNLSAVENAQKYFKEYHRAKDAAARVPALLEQANAEIEYAEQMLNDLELAENRAEIDAVVAAAREAGLIAEAKQKNHVKPSEPRAFTSRDGFTILVGKNARQNEDLTFHRARADDVWLHARNVAGAHVVIVKAGRDIPATTIEEAATLAAQYSQARHATAVDVIVTERKNVHRVRGGKPGLVTTTNAKIVRVVL